MSAINPNMGVSNIAQIDLSSMDIETALMMVQSQRVSMLDGQLKDQIAEVQKRNELTGQLNEMQSKLNAMKATLKNDAGATDKIADTDANRQSAHEYASIALSLGMSPDPITVKNVQYDQNGAVKSFELDNWRPEKQNVERQLADVKSQLDTASNSQQMDMLRLQSMSNKRNEAFDVMTNFIKKMQDSRSSIIGNMR